MKYFECKEAAKQLGITVRRVQQMCRNKEISGVKKEGKSWLIPESFIREKY